jgi:hypothetical protein
MLIPAAARDTRGLTRRAAQVHTLFVGGYANADLTRPRAQLTARVAWQTF